jgi:hypothetical protein
VLAASIGLLGLALTACDKDSSDLGTKDIEAAFTVEMDESDPAKPQTKLSAKLRESESSAAGPQGSVKLSQGDGLTVTTDKNDDVPLGESSAGLYEASLPNVSASVFTFRLKRTSGSSEGTVFTMPGPLAFTESPAGKSVGAGDTLQFKYSNQAPTRNRAPAKLYVSASHYPCGGAAITLAPKNDLPFDDLGSFSVEVAKLYDSGSPASGDCVDIRIRREAGADADAALDRASSVLGKRTDRLQVKIQ